MFCFAVIICSGHFLRIIICSGQEQNSGDQREGYCSSSGEIQVRDNPSLNEWYRDFSDVIWLQTSRWEPILDYQGGPSLITSP